MQVLGGVALLPGQLHRPAVVEDGAVDVEELLLLLDLLGVLEERPHHPGVRQHHVQPAERFFRAHRDASDTGAAGAGRLAGSAGGPASDSSFEYSTSAAPEPTSTMPSHSAQCGTVSPKCSGSP